jgi:hypothetical protein
LKHEKGPTVFKFYGKSAFFSFRPSVSAGLGQGNTTTLSFTRSLQPPVSIVRHRSVPQGCFLRAARREIGFRAERVPAYHPEVGLSRALNGTLKQLFIHIFPMMQFGEDLSPEYEAQCLAVLSRLKEEGFVDESDVTKLLLMIVI